MLIRKLYPVLFLLIVSISCKKEKDTVPIPVEKEFNLSGFTRIYSAEKINLVIERGSSFSIKAKGLDRNIDKLDIKLTGNGVTLNISYKETSPEEVIDVTVTLPHLKAALLSGQIKATLGGFARQPGSLSFILSGNANVTANGGAVVVGIEVAGNARLTLNGSTASLAGTVLENGSVSAYGLAATRAYITTTHHAKAYVSPSNIFYGSANDESRIFYKGDPGDKELETSGNGQIIKE